ncbi:DNA polymerase-3 subunit beta [Evansella caseinilytica]|uniref:Beta sliding clamp n=1 Tax=Evansella caseinilytica TaxID=1503961 RepID=A0A1H3USQ9_9BACI|nr:DNA polymerase III subunit beta [Evansella caseinilytica]SDZ65061.1 DNA polymerase-3 subunit beta [Evansella caseinilytica]
MNFTIHRDQFVQSVQNVSKAISSRTTIPILTGIKIDAAEDGVTLTGSDSDISIESFIPKETEDHQLVDIKSPGSIILPARFFAEIVKKLPEETIEVAVADQFLTTLKSGASEFKLNGLDPEEYPRLPVIEETNVFKLPTELLKNIIRQTVFAVSTVETRPILTGVHWAIDNGTLTCTATDSHRLAMRQVKAEMNENDIAFSNVVIPGKSLNELSKILDDHDEYIDIIVTDNQILFKGKNLLFFSRLLDGNYPATKNMIPTQSKTSVTLDTKKFMQAIERALLLSRDGKNNVVNFKTLDSDQLEITSVTPEVGKVTENLDYHDFNGEDLRISFNGKNIIDALRVIDSTEIRIDFTGAMSPFVMKPTENEFMLHLFSPVRTY